MNILSMVGADRPACKAILVILFLGLTAAGLHSQNLITNPGFESGNLNGWFSFGSDVLSIESQSVHSGSYAALVSQRTATYMGIAQSLQGLIQNGQSCSISAWLQPASASAETMYLTVQQTDGNGTSYFHVAGGSLPPGVWSQLSGSFSLNYSGTLTSLVLYAEMPSSPTNSFYIDDVSATLSTPPSTNAQCVVDWAKVFQRIDGFGASSAWNSSISSAQASLFFSTNSGAGLSLLRSRIAPDGTTVESSVMQMAQSLGARVWSTPWSPPASIKGTNQNGVVSVNGGPLIGNPSNYQAYASQLARYVVNMKNNYGIPIYAISVQNEPDTDTTQYESCVWTAQQFHDFIPYLSATLAASNVASTKILFPESFTWAGHLYFQQTAMNDPSVAPLVGIIADHNYDGINFQTGDINPPAAITNYGKALWETEVSTGDPFDGSISNAVYWAGRIHLFMTVAQANAWHYWWLIPSGSDNQGLTDSSGNPAKRLYALGNFSRFVRPGYYRMGVDTNNGPLEISAYQDATNEQFAIVAINPTSSSVTQGFNLQSFDSTQVTPWITSASLSLSSQSIIPVTNSAFSAVIPPMSIVTFVGFATNRQPPVLASIPTQIIGAGMTLTLTNQASDNNIPFPPLTYSLLGAPSNAKINTTNGIFTWRPLVSQADTTNSIVVKVVDNVETTLSDTNQFEVIVQSLALPVLNLGRLNPNSYLVSITGALGPDYTLRTSTNLITWSSLSTTNPVSMPLNLQVSNTLDPRRFYRLLLGP